MKKKFDDNRHHIKSVDDKVSSKEKNNDNMNHLNHVAIIMDGNGRWGLKYKNSETLIKLV